MKKSRWLNAECPFFGHFGKILFKMKLTLIFILAGIIQVVAVNSYSQTKKLTMELRNVSVVDVLKAIEDRSEFYFVYNKDAINMERKVDLNVKDLQIDVVLDNLFKDSNVSYKILDRHIILSTLEENQSNKSISGKVTDSSGVPLPGVTVLVKGTAQGTTTDSNGNYSLPNVPGTATLLFSFVGMKNQEFVVGSKTTINVSLLDETVGIEEVVAVGYGKERKSTMTGSVSVVKSKELAEAPTGNLTNSLVGKMPGLIATQRSGEPGSDGSNLYIRGVSTFGDNTPLYVIDGIPRSSSDFSQIPANEIESVSILKDASASAVFGVRGANGVVLVTTKRGVAGKMSLTYTVNTGFQKPTRLMDFLGSADYAMLWNEAMRNAGQPETFSADDIQKYKDGSDPIGHPNTDWYKETFTQTPVISQHNLSINGGSDKAKYFVSLGYLNQSGLYPTSGFERYNVRSNIDAEITKSTNVTIDLAFRRESQKQPGAGNSAVYEQLTGAPSIYLARYDDTHLAANGQGYNPIYYVNETGYNKNVGDRLTSQFTINQKLSFIAGLEVKAVVAADIDYSFNKNWLLSPGMYNKDAEDLRLTHNGAASLNESFNQGQSVTSELHLIYGHTFGKHAVNGLLLYTQNRFKSNYLQGSRRDYVSDKLDQLFAGDDKLKNNNGSAGSSAYMGYVGRLNYVFDRKYTLETSFRYDGSDRFGPGHKWGFFPSVSAGWVLSNENFIKDNLSFLTFAKIRGSYGKLGNDRLGGATYLYLATYGYGSPYGFGGSSATPVKTLNENALANPNATWEEATKYDIGMETRILDRIGFDLGYFYQRRSKILGYQSASIPDLLGASLPPTNFEIIDNKGVEVGLSYHNSTERDFTYSVNGNITYTKNKIIDFAEPSNIVEWQRRTGHSIGQFYGYESLGLFQTADEIAKAPKQTFGETKPGDIRYKDVDKNGVINSFDMTAVGRSNIPQIIYGLSFRGAYKGLDLTVVLQGDGLVDQYLAQDAAWAFFNGLNAQTNALDRWTPTNPKATYPRVLASSANNNTEPSSYWIHDASYVRLKNIEIGYNLPQMLCNKISAQSLRIYVSGLNMLTFSKIKTLDPENSNERAWAYPQMKTSNIGLSIQF